MIKIFITLIINILGVSSATPPAAAESPPEAPVVASKVIHVNNKSFYKFE